MLSGHLFYLSISKKFFEETLQLQIAKKKQPHQFKEVKDEDEDGVEWARMNNE